MNRAAAVLVLGFLASSPAFAFRCGTKLVSEGDSRAEVAAKCGEPTDVVNQKTVFRRPVIWNYGRPYFIGEDFIEIPVETWIYNLGPNKLMQRLRFEGGFVTEVETMGYGYNQ
ncbi:MAG TPA: DUF2845 domain-containing protein [Steroidobacteraceae bacterium]|jgi:hypothetical protein|nr:DUF2845 domain-containing protein [Steroidobacteraceae bacterium]